MTRERDDIALLMQELFKFRRLGQTPREAMHSVLEHLVRPENPTVAEGMKVHCIDAMGKEEGEARLFFGFVIQLAVKLDGRRKAPDQAELLRLAPLVHESYAREQQALAERGEPLPLTPELRRVDAVLKDHHHRLHSLGNAERYVYWGALVAFPVFWLVLRWRWWQAGLAQVGVYVALIAASLLLAGAQVRSTVRRIAGICPPDGPNYEPVLRMISGYEQDHVQLRDDVIKGLKALKA